MGSQVAHTTVDPVTSITPRGAASWILLGSAFAAYATLTPMPIYLVTPLEGNADRVARAIASHADLDSMEMQNKTGYLISFKGTTVELSNKLGITVPNNPASNTVGSAVVTSVTSYFGRGPTAMWEWLKTRIERQ